MNIPEIHRGGKLKQSTMDTEVNLCLIAFVCKMGSIWEELAPRFKDRLEQGKVRCYGFSDSG